MAVGVLRCVLCLAGVLGSTWAAFVMPRVRSASLAHEVSARIVADERFRPSVLGELYLRLSGGEQLCPVEARVAQALALVKLSAAEDATKRLQSDFADTAIQDASERIGCSLALAPADAFLWLSLYTLETFRNGFDQRSLSYLDQSYRVAPFEGWIALKRNKLALSVFALMQGASQQKTVSEFAGLVSSGFVDAASSNLIGAGWSQREQLLGALSPLDSMAREAFAKKLAHEGVREAVPGVEMVERPWR